jgi:endonuclease YncB( thermonuclease family)
MIGQASVIDGIHSTRIRLWGIDAPESTQLCRGEDSDPYRCGAQAANDRDTFIARRPVSCNPITLDRYADKLLHPTYPSSPALKSNARNHRVSIFPLQICAC